MEADRFKFALYSKSWQYDLLDTAALKANASEIIVTDYQSEMKGHIFCPECCVPLFRSPEKKDFDAGGRGAFYSHSRKYHPFCSLRVEKAEGKRYDNEEHVTQVTEDDEVVVVNEFLQEKPVLPNVYGPKVYAGSAVEDQAGEPTEEAIGRHNGEKSKCPRKFRTVKGLCRNFDRNLRCYYIFPSQSYSALLANLLVDIRKVKKVNVQPKLYYAKIRSSKNRGSTPRNIRITRFEYPKGGDYTDFSLKTTDLDSQQHGIDDQSEGKIVLMYGSVEKNGVGLCLAGLGWGEYAVLPDKYAYLLKG